MSLFKQNTARHRAGITSSAVRNTTIAAAAGAALIGSIAPAQAYAEIPVASSTTSWAPVASSAANFATNTYQAPAAAQPVATPASQASAPEQTATTASLSTQSADITPLGADSSSAGLVATAMQGEGTGYVWGGTAFGAWDCSGFTQWVYAQNGIDIPRTTTPTADPARPPQRPGSSRRALGTPSAAHESPSLSARASRPLRTPHLSSTHPPCTVLLIRIAALPATVTPRTPARGNPCCHRTVPVDLPGPPESLLNPHDS